MLIAIIPALITAIISGLFSYFLAIKKSTKDIEQLAEKHKQEMETMREQHKLEIEKLQLQQEHEKKMKEQDAGTKIGADIVTSLLGGIMKSNKMQQTIDKMLDEKFHPKEKK